SAVFTRLVHSRPRPQLAPRRRRIRMPRPDRRGAIAALVATVVIAGAGTSWGLGVWTPTTHRSGATGVGAQSRGGLPPGVDESLVSQTADVGTNAPVSAAPSSSVPFALTAASAAQVLAGLDDLRQHAFALREPVLLTGVYPQGKLLDDDTALLLRLVPRNCGLQGVHTTYSNVTIVSRSDTGVVVSAQAALAPSVLVCGATAT